jgi:hypothetical protein
MAIFSVEVAKVVVSEMIVRWDISTEWNNRVGSEDPRS